jgi:hypothetical protein
MPLKSWPETACCNGIYGIFFYTESLRRVKDEDIKYCKIMPSVKSTTMHDTICIITLNDSNPILGRKATKVIGWFEKEDEDGILLRMPNRDMKPVTFRNYIRKNRIHKVKKIKDE